MAAGSAKLVAVGALKGPHGLKGLVKARLDLDDAGLVVAGGPLQAADGRVFRVLQVAGAGQGLFSLKIEGVDSVEAAEGLRGVRVFLDRANWPQAAGEVYVDELVGMAVVDGDGIEMGRVDAVVALPAGTALEVDGKVVPLQAAFAAVADGRVVLTALGMEVLRLA